MPSTDRAVAAIRHHGLGLADAAEGNFEALVDCCPGWTVADLVWHVRGVHYFWGSMVEGLLDDPDRVPEIERPTGNDRLLADYRAGVSRMADILSNAEQTAPALDLVAPEGRCLRHAAPGAGSGGPWGPARNV